MALGWLLVPAHKEESESRYRLVRLSGAAPSRPDDSLPVFFRGEKLLAVQQTF